MKEEIIADILPVRISSAMSVSTLFAMETIYNLRSDLAFSDRRYDEATYANLQCHRLSRISGALTRKYKTAKTLNERIEILERIEAIEQCLSCGDSHFALEEASKLAGIPDLTSFQRVRLSWLTGMDAGRCGRMAADLLPQAEDAFDVATLSMIKDFCAGGMREAIIGRFTEIFMKALSESDAAGLGTLLAAAAVWNADPALRPKVAELARRAADIVVSVPEKRVNAIAAEIYSRLDFLSVSRA